MAKEEDLFHLAFSFKGIPVMDKFVGPNAEITRLAKLKIFFSINSIYHKDCLLHRIGGVGIPNVQQSLVKSINKTFFAIVWIANNITEKLRRSIAAFA